MLSAANKSGSWENHKPDNGLSKTPEIEVRRLADVLATDAARTITRLRNARSREVSSAVNATSLGTSALRAGAASRGSLPPTGSQLHRAALARSAPASKKKLQQQEQSQLKLSPTQPRTRGGRRRPPSTYDYHRWAGRPCGYGRRRTQAQRCLY